MHPRAIAFGITASERADVERLGAAIEDLGYDELWTNDTRRGDGVATLAAVEPGTRSLGLAIGVVALSEHASGDILARLSAARLPMDRLTLGVGSGSSSSLDLVRRGVAELHASLENVPIAVAAVGPRMLRLGGEVADAVVMTWSVPDRLSTLRLHVAEAAAGAGRPVPRIVAYVRTALGPGAGDRLRADMQRYRSYGGGHYARAFDEQPDTLVGVAVESGDPAELRAALKPYREVVDTLVVRALPTGDSVEAWLEVARAASPLGVAW